MHHAVGSCAQQHPFPVAVSWKGFAFTRFRVITDNQRERTKTAADTTVRLRTWASLFRAAVDARNAERRTSNTIKAFDTRSASLFSRSLNTQCALFSFECLSCTFLYGDLFWYWLDPQQMNLECYCLTYASAFEMLIFRVFHVLFQTVYTAFLLLHVILVVVPA